MILEVFPTYMILWLSFEADSFPKSGSLWHASWMPGVAIVTSIPHATASHIPCAPTHLLGSGFYLAGVEAIDWFDQLPGLPSHLAPLLGRCKERKQRGLFITGGHGDARPEMCPPPPQTTAGIFKHTTALREDYDNSHRVVRANSVYNPPLRGAVFKPLLLFFFLCDIYARKHFEHK